VTDPNPDDPSPGDAVPPADDGTAEPLPLWARVASIVVGVLATAAGAYAVFVSDNQAGTAFLLLIGAVLLVLGMQGTPLRRFASGDNSVELATIRRRAAVVMTQVASRESPEVFAAVSDAVAAIDPRIVRPSTGVAYERAVAAALRRVGATVSLSPVPDSHPRRVDGTATLRAGRAPIEIVYRQRGAVGASEIDADKERDPGGAVVLITNAPVSAESALHNAAVGDPATDVEVVTWNDARDDDVLAATLTRNAR
jgi:hypothetical protein